METIEYQTVKTFANISDLLKKTANRNVYVKLSSGYCCRVSKADLRAVAKSSENNGDKFCGEILFANSQYVQIDIQ